MNPRASLCEAHRKPPLAPTFCAQVANPNCDAEGHRIQGHGGCIWVGDDGYYWFGEHRVPRGTSVYGDDAAIGVSCYRSDDLCCWWNTGLALDRRRESAYSEMGPGFVLERPKVVRNPRTGHFVMWLHIDAFGIVDGRRRYAHARAGVAISRSGPCGPYAYLGSTRPGGEESRDLTVFQDFDGQAYLVFSGDRNRTLFIAKLSDDYLEVRDPAYPILPGQMREAPVLVRDRDFYFLVTSGCTGWEPNSARLHRAASLFGPWQDIGDPCRGPGAEMTFGAQGAYAFAVKGSAQEWILMANCWNPEELCDSRHLWLQMARMGPADFEIRRLGS